mmetsp:Transcript_59602/g.124513  ORF Transcript_59602/g.124513 Transcript_59602/m.124513 type:complete len:208 (-) Transcript_59602:1012-1635(-)
MRVSGAGGSMKSKCTRSSMPSFLRVSTTDPRFDLSISGYVCSCSSLVKAFCVYSRKHLPGRVRPARPARWFALAWEMAVTRRDSTRMRGLYTFCLLKPGSTTYTMPSIVSDVSAMLVDTTTLRPGGPPLTRGSGAGSKTFCCSAGGSAEYSGTHTTGPTSVSFWPLSSISILLHACSISSSPVRKMRMSPGGSQRWICTAVRMAASR